MRTQVASPDGTRRCNGPLRLPVRRGTSMKDKDNIIKTTYSFYTQYSALTISCQES